MKPETLENGCVLISDDVEVIRILTDHGLLDKLVPMSVQGRDDNQVSHCFESTDHWCLATLNWGNELPKDNGYLLCMAPKTRFSKDEAVHIFAGCITDWSSVQNFAVRYFTKTEIKNQ